MEPAAAAAYETNSTAPAASSLKGIKELAGCMCTGRPRAAAAALPQKVPNLRGAPHATHSQAPRGRGGRAAGRLKPHRPPPLRPPRLNDQRMRLALSPEIPQSTPNRLKTVPCHVTARSSPPRQLGPSPAPVPALLLSAGALRGRQAPSGLGQRRRGAPPSPAAAPPASSTAARTAQYS
jgi:hypothetical protein